jgi:hypothetical protein
MVCLHCFFCCNGFLGLPGVRLILACLVLMLRLLARLLCYGSVQLAANPLTPLVYVALRLCMHAAGVLAGTAVGPLSAVASLLYTLEQWHAELYVCFS